MSDLDINRLQQRAYRRALRDAVDMLKTIRHKDTGAARSDYLLGLDDAIAAIEALSTNADTDTNVHERRQAAAELTRMAQEDGLS